MSSNVSIVDAVNQAIQHHNAGRLDQAEQIYRQVLAQAPDHPDALHLLGVLYQQRGQIGVSIELIARAIAVKPKSGVFHSNLGEAFRRIGLSDEAEVACKRAVALAENLVSAHANLAVVQLERGQLDDAERAVRRALEIEPDNGSAMVTLGNILKAKGDLGSAIEICRRLVQRFPNESITHNNLAAALEANGQLDEAEDEYRAALKLAPQFFEVMNNLGSLLRRKGDITSAMQWWQKALDHNPSYSDPQWNLALGYLLHGDYAKGWPLFELRFRNRMTRDYLRDYPSPQWTGFDIKGKTILLYPEQGYGDVIQFARFVAEVKARGAQVVMHMPRELVELMKGTDGVDQVVGPDETMPAFDTYCALLSLPAILGTTMQTLPNKVPYITVDPARTEAWRQRIASHPGKLKIGLVWAGRATNTEDRVRSMTFDTLHPLADVPDVTYFSLQKGEATAQLADAPAHMQIVNLDPDLKDFADTAAVIANLDMVIAIDTAVAHLSGALAVKTWTMIPFTADYRWLLNRTDSPWYPTMRLFRQPKYRDWTTPVAQIVDELKRLV